MSLMGPELRGFRALAWLGCLLAASPAFRPLAARAEERGQSLIRKEESTIPRKTTSPPMLGAAKPPNPDNFRCPRLFSYRGKVLNCDSNLGWDGENLRPIIQGVPDALAELDEYQNNRNKVVALRYVGTAGVVLMLTGFILGKTMDVNNPDRVTIRNLGVIGGATMAIGSFAWGLAIIKGNESRLGRAAALYNQSHPKDPIELQFSTGLRF